LPPEGTAATKKKYPRARKQKGRERRCRKGVWWARLGDFEPRGTGVEGKKLRGARSREEEGKGAGGKIGRQQDRLTSRTTKVKGENKTDPARRWQRSNMFRKRKFA